LKSTGKFVSTEAQRVSITLGQRLFKGQKYAIVCPNLTYLWRHSHTALLLSTMEK